MSDQSGFWSGMPAGAKIRFLAGLAYLAAALGVLSQAPIAGMILLMLPVLWTVFVIWIGSEGGMNSGPLRQKGDTAFVYVLRYVWRSSSLAQVFLAFLVTGFVVGGLGWISTEGLRADAAKPTLTERVTTAADSATQATKKTIGGWVSTAKGWFTPSDESQSSS